MENLAPTFPIIVFLVLSSWKCEIVHQKIYSSFVGMRIGTNPHKNSDVAIGAFYHQLVIPVYIPNEDGYFEDSFTILKHCLTSILRTSHEQTFITVVDNGSMPEVGAYLDNLLRDEKIHEVVHTANIGKVNACLKGISGHRFELITIADADVLFLNGWQAATYKIFEDFPKTGMVSTTPNPKLWKYHTAPTLRRFFYSSRLRAMPLEDPDALTNFANSLGNENYFNTVHYQKTLTLHGRNTKAVLGSGHFVATYRGTIFYTLSESYSEVKLGPKSVRKFLDAPVSQLGLWRLATAENYSLHMGNRSESWMEEVVATTPPKEETIRFPELTPFKKPTLVYQWFLKLQQRLFAHPWFYKRFLRQKGFTSEEIEVY